MVLRKAAVLAVSALTCLVVAVPLVGQASHQFTDVPDSHIFHDAVSWLADSGLTKGCNPPNNDRFCPDDFITRGEMAVFLIRVLRHSEDGGGDLFVDDDGRFYENSADRLATAGVTEGCNPPVNDRFCGEDLVTRGQMAAFLARAFSYTTGGGADLFVDDDGHLFENAIDRLGTAGVTQGCNPPVNDRFCPDDYVTRGQMAVFLKRAMTPERICAQTSVSEPECLALLALYEGNDGENWRLNNAPSVYVPWWSTPDVCQWAGVGCAQGGVVALGLGRNRLTGSIPVEVGDLINLKYLDLFENQLTGTVPDEIGALADLEIFWLANNQLTGEIPSGIGDLINLQRIDVSNNQLTGPIPAGIGNLINLQRLELTNNQLTGGIPSGIGDLMSLSRLWLANNHLSGPIPTEIGNLSGVLLLELNHNQLTGPIPTEIGNLTQLQHLPLNNNQLTGSIPAEIGNLTGLQSLHLDHNQLTGPIPAEIESLTDLSGMYLNDNQLTGSIPVEIGNLTRLDHLDLSENQLTGMIPPEIGDLWYCDGPDDFVPPGCHTLQTLDLSQNQLTGSIPVQIGIYLDDLERLYLNDNQLTDQIPSSLGFLAGLEELNLAANGLSGEVATSLGLGTSIEFLRLRGQTGCLFTNDLDFGIWLDGLDGLWDDGCP